MLLINFDNFSKDEVLTHYMNNGLKEIVESQKAIPELAKDKQLVDKIERILPLLPTRHDFYRDDATKISSLKPNSVHLNFNFTSLLDFEEI